MKTQGNARQMLMDLGSAPSLATIALPYVWMLPGTTDPDAQGVIEIVRCIQRGLRGLGHKVMVSGVLDRTTAETLDLLVPPKGSWPSTTWIVIMQRLQHAIRNPRRVMTEIEVPMGLGGYYGYGPLPGRMVGLPAGPLGLGATVQDAGADLEFGRGIKIPTNIVPVPKDSGRTFEAFRNLQRQVNRLLTRIPNGGRVDEDGIIGESTRKSMEKLAAGLPIPIGNTVSIAQKAVTWGSILKSLADKAAISATANKASTVSVARATEPPVPPMSQTDANKFSQAGFFSFLDAVPGGKFIPFIALGVGAAWIAVRSRKKRSS